VIAASSRLLYYYTLNKVVSSVFTPLIIRKHSDMSDYGTKIRNFRKHMWSGSSFLCPSFCLKCEVFKHYAVVGWNDLNCCSRSVTGKYLVVFQYFNVFSINHQGCYRSNGSGVVAGCALPSFQIPPKLHIIA